MSNRIFHSLISCLLDRNFLCNQVSKYQQDIPHSISKELYLQPLKEKS